MHRQKHTLKDLEFSRQCRAGADMLWKCLTDTELAKSWMADAGFSLEIESTWQEQSPVLIQGQIHGHTFRNDGLVLKSLRPLLLVYTHRSSLSNLSADFWNYCILHFTLAPFDDGCTIHLRIENFPTETIRQHVALYWNTTLKKLCEVAEAMSAH